MVCSALCHVFPFGVVWLRLVPDRSVWFRVVLLCSGWLCLVSLFPVWFRLVSVVVGVVPLGPVWCHVVVALYCSVLCGCAVLCYDVFGNFRCGSVCCVCSELFCLGLFWVILICLLLSCYARSWCVLSGSAWVCRVWSCVLRFVLSCYLCVVSCVLCPCWLLRVVCCGRVVLCVCV